MRLWARLRNHKRLNELEDEVQRLNEDLKKVKAQTSRELGQLKDQLNAEIASVKSLEESLKTKTEEKIQVTEEIRLNMSGATVSFGFVPEEHVSIQDLSKSLSQDYVYVQ